MVTQNRFTVYIRSGNSFIYHNTAANDGLSKMLFECHKILTCNNIYFVVAYMNICGRSKAIASHHQDLYA